jgi:hypothetical protein
MQQNDDGAILWTGRDGVQSNAAVLEGDGFQEDFPCGESLLAAADRPLGKNMRTQR